jgi:hypothetical protein
LRGGHGGDGDGDDEITSSTNSILPQPEQLPRVGIYAELKDTTWLLEDTSVNWVQLFFQHYESNQDLWNAAIDGEQACKAHRLTDFLAPPLVLQSFDGTALQSVEKQWKTRIPTIPMPSCLVILVGKDKCQTEKCWYQVDESWRDILLGIGPDKECILDDENNNNYFLEHDAMLGLAVHPWTIRPEIEHHQFKLSNCLWRIGQLVLP